MSPQTARPSQVPGAQAAVEVSVASIGQLLVQSQVLAQDQVPRVLEHQRQHGLRFGDAAVALGLAERDEVLRALASQFEYPYHVADGQGLEPELVMAHQPFSEEVESFRDLRSHLLMTVLAPHTGQRLLTLVSAEIGEGKTFVAANLAVAFSQLPGSTLVVDADMRTPRLHHVFGIGASNGLSGLLSGRTQGDAIHRVPGLPNLHVLPVGTVPPNPLELLQRNSFGLLLGELAARFDYVVIDTPAAAHGSDARMVASRAGAALMVSRRHITRARRAQSLLTQLGKAQVTMAGVLVNEF